jgi:signal transduction histidine kinase
MQLALFYLALSLPALLVIEQLNVAFEFQRCLEELDDGRVDRVLAIEAQALAQAMLAGARDTEVEQRLKRFVLELERPRQSLGTSAAYILLELTDHPFRAALWSGTEVRLSAGEAIAPAPGIVERHWSVPIADTPMRLALDLAVPSPWRHLGQRLSFEWPIAVSYLALFLVGSAWFLRRRVLTRVGSMGKAARAWARGDFTPHLNDASGDELGELARDLDRMAADLKALVDARAQLATLEERRRLARDLHDTVKQKVFALSLQLAAAREGAAQPERASQRLSEAAALVEEIQRELSDQLRELREDAGADEDLVPALQRRLDDFTRRSGCALEYSLPPSLNLAPTLAETVLRIVDEALANVWRHAGATQVRVTLLQEDARIRLSIVDDGKGGAHDSTLGMGLSNMRHRTASLPGGSVRLVSPEGAGTGIHLEFFLRVSRIRTQP